MASRGRLEVTPSASYELESSVGVDIAPEAFRRASWQSFHSLYGTRSINYSEKTLANLYVTFTPQQYHKMLNCAFAVYFCLWILSMTFESFWITVSVLASLLFAGAIIWMNVRYTLLKHQFESVEYTYLFFSAIVTFYIASEAFRWEPFDTLTKGVYYSTFLAVISFDCLEPKIRRTSKLVLVVGGLAFAIHSIYLQFTPREKLEAAGFHYKTYSFGRGADSWTNVELYLRMNAIQSFFCFKFVYHLHFNPEYSYFITERRKNDDFDQFSLRTFRTYAAFLEAEDRRKKGKTPRVKFALTPSDMSISNVLAVSGHADVAQARTIEDPDHGASFETEGTLDMDALEQRYAVEFDLSVPSENTSSVLESGTSSPVSAHTPKQGDVLPASAPVSPKRVVSPHRVEVRFFREETVHQEGQPAAETAAKDISVWVEEISRLEEDSEDEIEVDVREVHFGEDVKDTIHSNRSELIGQWIPREKLIKIFNFIAVTMVILHPLNLFWYKTIFRVLVDFCIFSLGLICVINIKFEHFRLVKSDFEYYYLMLSCFAAWFFYCDISAWDFFQVFRGIFTWLAVACFVHFDLLFQELKVTLKYGFIFMIISFWLLIAYANSLSEKELKEYYHIRSWNISENDTSTNLEWLIRIAGIMSIFWLKLAYHLHYYEEYFYFNRLLVKLDDLDPQSPLASETPHTQESRADYLSADS